MRASNRSPTLRPMAYPTVSPTTAPAAPATTAASSGTRPWWASTPPSTRASSPGTTIPSRVDASSAGRANTATRTRGPARRRIVSESQVIVMGRLSSDGPVGPEGTVG
jgi:hypothetical protein